MAVMVRDTYSATSPEYALLTAIEAGGWPVNYGGDATGGTVFARTREGIPSVNLIVNGELMFDLAAAGTDGFRLTAFYRDAYNDVAEVSYTSDDMPEALRAANLTYGAALAALKELGVAVD